MTQELVERDDALRVLDTALQAVANDAVGRIVLVAGEAGIGKTSLLRTFVHAKPAATLWWGACDALQTPQPLAPLHDIAREAAPRFAPMLDGPRQALFDAVLDDLRRAATPMIVVVEDAHWADDATLDWLKFVGRRIERTRALLLLSYRDDEVTASHPLRRVLGELPLSARTLLELPRLSAAAVDELARRHGTRADGVFAATRGNAFFATEMLRDTAQPRAAVPRSVRDVVLARYARLPMRVQALLQALAVVPGRSERWLVDELAAPTGDDIEAALASGLVVAEGATLAYRHELGRVAVETALSAPMAQALHARALAALAEPARATPPARLVHHALHAQDVTAISLHAPRAAAEARERGALREWGAHARVAAQQGRPRDDDERCAWLESYAVACSVNAWPDETLQTLQTLERLYRARGDLARAAVKRAQQSGPLVGLLRHEHAREACRDALALVEKLPLSAETAQVWGFTSWQYMLDRDYADSIAWGRRAIALAERLGDPAALERATTATGAALLFVEPETGRRLLLDLAERRRARGDRLGTASSLGMVGSGLGETMHLVHAEACLRESIELLESLDIGDQYARAWRALVLLSLGRWEEAGSEALHVLQRAGDDMSALMGQVALARLRLRRGDPGADDAIAIARRLAEPSGTLQRMAPCAAVRAEAAFARGDTAQVRAAVASALPLATAKGHPWFVGELNYWLWRAGAIDAAPEGCAEPYALEIAGRWREAADAWAALSCPYERARALSLGDAAAQQAALAAFESLGAVPAAEALRRRLREAGVRGVARGAREATRSHPCGLTGAEAKVLALMADGLRNADIAARLHRSVRTVDHHVAAVLAKLDVPSRNAAVQRARREGWLTPAPGRRDAI